jgi:hypothetical protein
LYTCREWKRFVPQAEGTLISSRLGDAARPQAPSKHWRPLHRWIGRREDLPETIRAIGSLVSDRGAAW